MKSVPQSKLNVINYDLPVVVFDIDRVIAIPIRDQKISLDKEKSPYGNEFDLHYIEVVGYKHQIYLGIYALLRALKARNVKIVFFSSGREERNLPLIESIYKIAFGDEYQDCLNETDIFSRHHCIHTENLGSEDYRLLYSPHLNHAYTGNLKKDLQIVLLKPEVSSYEDIINPEEYRNIDFGDIDAKKALSNMVLIEDDPSYMVKGQEHNFLYLRDNFIYPSLEKSKFIFDDSDDDKIVDNKEQIEFYHLFYLYYVLDNVLDIFESKKIPFRDAMFEFQMSYNDREKFEKELASDLPTFIGTRDFSYSSKFKTAIYKKRSGGLEEILANPRFC